jgi:hypothetical protein
MHMSKLGVIFFHKNIRSIYKERWINKCIETILNQTLNDFKIYEINYGGEDYSVFNGISHDQEREFYSKKFSNHAEAMNFIIDHAFSDGCDVVFNTNLDDFYTPNRIEKQMIEIKNGADLVSSNMCYFEERDGADTTLKYFNFFEMGPAEKSLTEGNNVIAHPVVAFSKNFWNSNRYDPSEVPLEDFLLWKRAASNDMKISIVNDYLLNYRLHSSQITGDNSGVAAFLRKNLVVQNPQVSPTTLR